MLAPDNYHPVDPASMRFVPQSRLPNLRDVLHAAAAVSRMPVYLMTSKDRTVAVANARWAYYIVARKLGFADREIACEVRRSRYSVQHGCRWGALNNPKLAADVALTVAILSAKFPYARFE